MSILALIFFALAGVVFVLLLQRRLDPVGALVALLDLGIRR